MTNKAGEITVILRETESDPGPRRVEFHSIADGTVAISIFEEDATDPVDGAIAIVWASDLAVVLHLLGATTE